jgi:hypothetical protein
MGITSNPWIYEGIAAILLLQLVFVYAPFMHVIFGSAPLSLLSWGEAALAGLLIMQIISVGGADAAPGGPKPIKAAPEVASDAS